MMRRKGTLPAAAAVVALTVALVTMAGCGTPGPAALSKSATTPSAVRTQPGRTPGSIGATSIQTSGAPGAPGTSGTPTASGPSGSINGAFIRAATESGVPVPLLEALCYMEGRLSSHGGSPSIDGGYGCMHLVQNSRGDTLDQAARDLGVSQTALRDDTATNIRGGAAVLRDEALSLSPTHTLPATLGGWYGAAAAYSMATTRTTALLYANALFSLMQSGFSARAETGEQVTLAPTAAQPDTTTARSIAPSSTLPAGCVNDGKVDYPGAIDCILNPNTYDCEVVAATAPCTYDEANRPTDLPISFVVIHDIEGTAQDALNVFQDPTSAVSIHYIVDSNGTIYQVLHEKDVAWHAGNYWYNQHAIGIEHAGFDATGYQWYNTTEYLASAKLVAYLLKKYGIPLDHAHIVSHGTVPSPGTQYEPNHVDPGPFWLWDYYFGLIHQQGVAFPPSPSPRGQANIVELRPPSDTAPLGANGTETQANYSFASVYTGPSTKSPLIPYKGTTGDLTNETFNIEPHMTYAVVAAQPDQAGTGDMMYEIWYGAEDQNGTYYADGQKAWVAFPPGSAWPSAGTVVTLQATGGATAPVIYGRPDVAANMANEVIGSAPVGALLVSEMTTTVTDTSTGTTTLWYEVEYDHRQAWVPATEVSHS